MSKRRIQNLERDLEIAESDYREQLVAALRHTATGHGGFFVASQLMDAASRTAAVGLLELGPKINEIREQLGVHDPYDLHERYLALRRVCRETNVESEQKLAQRFLADVEAEDSPAES